MGVFERDEVGRFADAAKFIWAVRCHLHDLAGRAQEQLTFDRQVEIAERIGETDHDGRMAVEHFMHHLLPPRQGGGRPDTHLLGRAGGTAREEARRGSRCCCARSASAPDPLPDEPFVVRRRAACRWRDDEIFAKDPINMLRLFHDAARMDARIHPAAMRLV